MDDFGGGSSGGGGAGAGFGGCTDFCTVQKCQELEEKIQQLESALNDLRKRFEDHLKQDIPNAHKYKPDVKVDVSLATSGDGTIKVFTRVDVDDASGNDEATAQISLNPNLGFDISVSASGGDNPTLKVFGKVDAFGESASDSETIALQGLQGKKGDKGDAGEKGSDGKEGEKGEKGDKGDMGPIPALATLLDQILNRTPYTIVTLELVGCDLIAKSILITPQLAGDIRSVKETSIVKLDECFNMEGCCDDIKKFLQFIDNQMTGYTVQILDAIKKVKCDNEDIINKIDEEFNVIVPVINNTVKLAEKIDIDLGVNFKNVGDTITKIDNRTGDIINKVGNFENNFNTKIGDIITKIGNVDVKIGEIQFSLPSIITTIEGVKVTVGDVSLDVDNLVNIDTQITIDVKNIDNRVNSISACCDDVSKRLPPSGGGGKDCDDQFNFEAGYAIYEGMCIENTDEATKAEFPKLYTQQNSVIALSAAHALNLLSKQVEKVHTDLCKINPESGEDTVLLPDPDVIRSAKGKYLIFSWVLEENPRLKRYKGVTQLPDPIDTLWKDVTPDQVAAKWNTYFKDIYKIVGEQFSVYWSDENGRTPLTRGFFKDKIEAERYFNSIKTLIKKTPREQNNPVYSDVINQTYKPSNIDKKFILHSVAVIDKLQNSDECNFLIRYKNPSL